MTDDRSDAPANVLDAVKALTECENQVEQLKMENMLLRDASRAFGDLAERLNETLESERQSERRLGGDRRRVPRDGADRRRATPENPAARHD